MRTRHFSALIAASLWWTTAALAQNITLPEPPTDTKPGECYGLVYVPPQFRLSEESRLVAAASQRIEVVPAVYEMVDEQVLLPAGKRRKVITPAVTETVEEVVRVRGQQKQITVPATYKTVQQDVTVAHGAQLKTSKLLDDAEGAAICLVESASTKQTITTRVLDQPASTRLVQTAARDKLVKRQKVITPAVTELVAVPARTVTRRVKKLVTPETSRVVPVPARYETVTRRDLQTPARAEWQRVLCETNLTPSLVQHLQEALKREGVYRGAAHGKLNPQTSAAVRLYQERNGLPTGGLSLAMLDHLHISVGDGQAGQLRGDAKP